MCMYIVGIHVLYMYCLYTAINQVSSICIFFLFLFIDFFLHNIVERVLSYWGARKKKLNTITNYAL